MLHRVPMRRRAACGGVDGSKASDTRSSCVARGLRVVGGARDVTACFIAGAAVAMGGGYPSDASLDILNWCISLRAFTNANYKREKDACKNACKNHAKNFKKIPGASQRLTLNDMLTNKS